MKAKKIKQENGQTYLLEESNVSDNNSSSNPEDQEV